MQQSRFIALVSNADRLREVSEAAQDSEDAGLIQYAKTLDSLESKQANLKTSFQQFYMDIFNGDFFKGLIDGLNSFLEGLNKLPKWKSIFNVASIISGVKMLGTLGLNVFTTAFGQLRAQWKTTLENMGTNAVSAAKTTGQQYAEGVAQGTEEQTAVLEGEGRSPAQTATGQGQEGNAAAAGKKQGMTWTNKIGAGAIVAGGALSTIGASVSQNNVTAGNVVSGLGTGFSAGGNLMVLLSSITALSGGWIAGLSAAIAVVVSLISILVSMPSQAEKAAEEAKKAREKADDSNLKRAETAQEVSTLQSGIDKLKQLKKTQYDSAEAQQEYIEANNSLAESLPELISGFDEAGNAIIDITTAEAALAAARQRGAKEATKAAKDELEAAEKELNSEKINQYDRWEAVGYDKSGTQNGIGVAENISSFSVAERGKGETYNKIKQKQGDADTTTKQGQLLAGLDITQTEGGVIQVTNVPKYIATASGIINGLGGPDAFLNEESANWLLEHLDNSNEIQFYEDLKAAVSNGEILTSADDKIKELVIQKLEEQQQLWEAVYNGQQEVALKSTAVDTGKRLLYSRRISEYATDASLLENNESVFDNLQNATSIANAVIKLRSQLENPDVKIEDIDVEGEMATLETELKGLQDRLTQNGTLTDFNELIQSVESGKITLKQYEEALTELVGEDYGSIALAYYQNYEAQITQANDNITAALTSRGVYNGEQKDYGKIAQELSASVPQIYHEAIISYAKTLAAQVKAETLTQTSLNDRMEALLKIWQAAETVGDAALQGQVQSILGSTDFTSTFGKVEALDKLEDLGITEDDNIAKWINDFDTGAENLITSYGELTDSLSDSLDTINDNLLDAADGFKLEDAQKIAKKTGLDLSKDFTFANDRYFANSEEAFARINEASLKNTTRQLTKLKEKNKQEIDLLSSGKTDAEDYQQLIDTYKESAVSWVENLKKREKKGLLTENERNQLAAIDKIIDAEGQITDTDDIPQLIINYLQSLNDSMIAAGEQFIQNKLAEQSATRIDNLIKNISNGLESITGAVEGSLSALDFHEMSQLYGLTGEGATGTLAGLTLGQEDIQTLIRSLYRNSYDQFGVLGGGEFGKQLWDSIQASDNPLFKGYKDIVAAANEATAAAEKIKDQTSAAAKAAWDYADALQAAASAAVFDENSYEFTFMEQDATSGLTKNFDNFVGQIDSVKTALSSLKGQTAISYQDFYNLMDFIDKSDDGKGFQKLVTNTVAAGIEYEDFVNTVVAKSKEWGKVDIGTIAAQMGVSVNMAVKKMSEGMTSGLKEVATSQIKYLSGLEKMLEALEALESIGDVDLSLGVDFTTSSGEKPDLTLANISQYWEDICNSQDKKDIEVAVQLKLQDLGDAGLDSFFGTENWITTLFNEDGFSIDDADEVALASQFGILAEKVSTLTKSQLIALAQQMRQDLGKYLIFGDKNEIVGFEDGFIEAFGKWLADADLSNISEATDIEVQAAVNAQVATELTSVELTDDGQLKSTAGEIDQETKEQLASYYKEYGYNIVQIDVDKDGIIDVTLQHIQTKTFIDENGGWTWDEVHEQVEQDGSEELQTVFSKTFDFTAEGEGTTNVRVNLTNGGFTIDAAGSDLEQFYNSKTGLWDEAALQTAIEAQLGQKIGDLNISGAGAQAVITFTLATDVDTETALGDILNAINSISEILKTGIAITVEDKDATDKIANLQTALETLKTTANSIVIGDTAVEPSDSNTPVTNFSLDFSSIDTTPITTVATAVKDISTGVSGVNNLVTSLASVATNAQTASTNLANVVTQLDSIAEQTKLVNVDFNVSNTNLLSSALTILNAGTSVEIAFSGNGAEDVVKQANSVKEAIDNIAKTVSIRFSSIGGTSVVSQAQTVAAALAKISRTVKITYSTSGSPFKTPAYSMPIDDDNKYAGNVSLTGSALVNGQMYGAAVAGKTLVGELGPELAVYDNQYHLLGEKGAEFVDLPSDAIVFNHLQTQGIIDGKVDSIRGTQLKSAYNHAGTAYAAGNVGPALAGGVSEALAAVRRAKSVWQGLLNSLSAADLLNGGGGGGGGGGKASSLKPYLADLQEWYNLSRQIVDLEKRINVLVAQRNNLSKGFDQGATYLRNLKESQALLEDELNTQRDLYRYQVDELERQANAINDESNWISKFYKVGADGVLQYVEGNETNGGKGALEVLQELNEMGDNPDKYTIKDQIAWIEKVTNGQFARGYTWEAEQDDNGNVTGSYEKKYWTDEEYVQEFFSALQEPIDDYDSLRDTVQETETKFEELREEIEKINDEIRDNEIEVAQSIHDAIIDVREKAIDDLEESNKLVQEANQKYANAISDAISREREQYNQNQSIAERETLQRQLSLLRRSGGSASEIQNLEKTISDKLKDEYFTNQENSLEAIKDANDKQTELMNQQVQIMKDSLEYEKENGVIWTKAYEIMAEGNAFMLDFLSGAGADSFFEKSNLEQEKMLEEWAFKIGLYGENERSDYLQNKYTDAAFTELKNSTWEAGYKDIYDSMDAVTRSDWDEDFLKTYNSYLLEHINGQSTAEEIEAAKATANEKASQTFFEHIRQEKKRRDDNAKAAEEAKNNQGGNSGSSSGSSSGGSKKSSSSGATYTWKNTITGETGTASSKKAAEAALDKSYSKVYVPAGPNAQLGVDYLEEKKKASKAAIKKNTVKTKYTTGGYNTSTGLAWLDGTLESPEYILNAAQTAGLEQLVKFTMRNPDFVDVLKAHYDSLAGNIASQNYNTNNAQSIQIAEGAIQVNVAKLNDSYDINDISNDIMDRMYAIAAKSSSRSVKRR